MKMASCIEVVRSIPMPTWKVPTPVWRLPKRSEGRVLKGLTYSKVDLTRRCVCGCFLGNHYLTYVPGGHMCSTCESCDGFMAEGQLSGTA